MDFIIGYGDAWQYVWNFWWFKTALLDLHTNPFFTNYLHWPNGISLIFQTFSLTNTLAALPLQYIFGLVWTYNILLIAGFALTALASYQLAYYLTKNRLSALAAALIIAFSPSRWFHLLGHLDLVHFQWVVWYVLYLFKMRDGEATWKLPTLFMILTAYTNLYYLLYVSLFTVIFFIFNANKKLLKNITITAVVSIIVVSPYIFPMLTAGPDFDVLGHNPLEFSTNLVGFFKPNRAPLEGKAFLGYTAMLLTLYAFFKHRDKARWLWVTTGLVFATLSLGPYLHIRHAFFPGTRLPYAWLEDHIPLFSFSGVPGRMNLMTYLAIGIMVAYGIAELVRQGYFRHRITKIALLILLAFEYALTANPAISRADVPQKYYELASDPAPAVWDRSTDPAKALYYQTIYRKPMIGGYTTRPTKSTDEFLKNFTEEKAREYGIKILN